MEKVYKVANRRSLFLENGDPEDLPGYDRDEETDYVQRTYQTYQVIDPNDQQPVLVQMDLISIAALAYRFLLDNEPKEKILADINAMRELFYKARMAIKYPNETSHDPEYADAAQWLIDFYNESDPTIDPFTGEDRAPSFASRN